MLSTGIVLVAIILIILVCMFYTRKFNKRLATANRSRVSIRVEELFGQLGQVAWSTVV